jgi:hypothetical protein
MSEPLRNSASIGLGDLSPAPLTPALGPEKMAFLEQMDGPCSLRAQASPSASVGDRNVEGEDSSLRGLKQDADYARYVLKTSSNPCLLLTVNQVCT